MGPHGPEGVSHPSTMRPNDESGRLLRLVVSFVVRECLACGALTVVRHPTLLACYT